MKPLRIGVCLLAMAFPTVHAATRCEVLLERDVPVYPEGALESRNFHLENSAGWTYPRMTVYADHGETRVYLSASSERKVVLVQISKNRAEAARLTNFQKRHSELSPGMVSHLPGIEAVDPGGKWISFFYEDGVSGSDIRHSHAAGLPQEYAGPLEQLFSMGQELHRNGTASLNLSPENLIWNTSAQTWKVRWLDSREPFYSSFEDYLEREWAVNSISLGVAPR